ncbi:hypothetical protein ACFQY0_14135 [Haloferula chungangensis]|uniref:Tetratricopeptide repeat protein n=1 Tax=Haloferula chungangensis TaxID=1048331 RepID=A0ABW2L7F9_9BACT
MKGSAFDRNEEANFLTRRGIERAAAGQSGALEDFEEAIRIRLTLPLEDDPIFPWGLSAGWINRGDVLARDGRFSEAVTSYDEGIAVLGRLEESRAVKCRLAVAWGNRGLALEAMGQSDEARQSFGRGVVDEPEDDAQRLHSAVARVHLSRVVEDRKLAISEAEQALDLVRELESQDVLAAETGLKARHQLCGRLCEELEAGVREGDWIARVTDRVEEALVLERFWERRGVKSLRSVAADLFRLGLRVYRVCQPHFLAEFVLDAMDPERSPGAPWEDLSFQGAAAVALRTAIDDGAERGVWNAAERGERELAIIGTLRAADQRLAELQRPAH